MEITGGNTAGRGYEWLPAASVAELAKRVAIAGDGCEIERHVRTSDGHSTYRVCIAGGCVTSAGTIVAYETYDPADDVNDSKFCPPICRVTR